MEATFALGKPHFRYGSYIGSRNSPWFSLDFSQNETKMTDFPQNDQKLAKQTQVSGCLKFIPFRFTRLRALPTTFTYKMFPGFHFWSRYTSMYPLDFGHYLLMYWGKHEKIMIFYLRSKIVDPIFEGSRQSQMSWSTNKKHFFGTGSFLEQSYTYEVTQKNKKPSKTTSRLRDRPRDIFVTEIPGRSVRT